MHPVHRMVSPSRRHAAAAALMTTLALSLAAELRTDDGLGAVLSEDGIGLSGLSVEGDELPGVTVTCGLREPGGAGSAGAGFSVSGTWTTRSGYLELRGEATARGGVDTAADVVVAVSKVSLPTGTMDQDPLLLPGRLIGKLPLVSLGTEAGDCLGLAVPPDALAEFSFRQIEDGVELRFPFGFTPDGPERLRMRAPFACILYRADPRWHFRSALARYYESFPRAFERVPTPVGGWFFAAPTKDLPNPQHFAFHEGGPAGHDLDEERGLGTYPYRESSSFTVHLPGSKLPQTYEEAMARLGELEKETVAARWDPMHSFVLDDAVRRDGNRAIRVEVTEPGTWAGARQAVTLEPPVTEPFIISGWSRAERVTGPRDNGYAIYVDVCYADGSYLFGQCATFEPGTHDWGRSARSLIPAKPVSELRVYCLLRGTHTGRAWFDDLRIGPSADPTVNWVRNPGFETVGPRLDLKFLRDNVCYDAAGRMVVRITDNLSADVGPAHPMNLLRFTLNVDPDLPSRDGHVTVAEQEVQRFDRMLRDVPGLDGLYIDSVSAWCSRVLNTRREHWVANDVPFTYDQATRKVAAPGRFGTRDYLASLQRRYHPSGKAIFTNIHCSLEAFPLYLVSDVPGIESSRYRSEDDLFFYRACSYRKPLLLMNFMNLHGLDQRELAELFHLNAAFWGELPSTGRYVQRAYREYGDVTHAYMPAIRELAAAGWHPVPACRSLRAERFVDTAAVSFTARRSCGDEAVLTIDPEAVAAVRDDDLVAIDAVCLTERPLTRTPAGWRLDLADSLPELAVTRIMPRTAVAAWFVTRVRAHVAAAGRVKGTASLTPAIKAAARGVEGIDSESPDLGNLGRCRSLILAAEEAVVGTPDDLFALSQQRELAQARHALESLALHRAGAHLGFGGPRCTVAGTAALVTARISSGNAAVRTLAISRERGRSVVPSWTPRHPLPGQPVDRPPEAPGRYTVRAVWEAAIPGMPPFLVEQATSLLVQPAVDLTATGSEARAGHLHLTIGLGAASLGQAFRLVPSIEPAAGDGGTDAACTPGQTSAVVRLPQLFDGVVKQVTVKAVLEDGRCIGSVQTNYMDEPGLPEAAGCRPAACRTDSSYEGYSPDVLTDRVVTTEGLHWTKRAWASQDNGNPHWIRLELEGNPPTRGLLIYWNCEDGASYAARRYRVVAETPEGDRQVAEADDDRERSFDRLVWDGVRASALRLEQEARGGAVRRPGIMWIREVIVLGEPADGD